MILITIVLIFIEMIPGGAFSGKAVQMPVMEMGETFPAGLLTITIQPVDLNDCKGNKATFSVATQGGTGTIHYLWKRKRPGDVSFMTFGAKDSIKLPVYNIGVGTEAPDKTLYQVTLSDQETEITSLQAMLTVNQITGISPTGVAVHNLNQGENLSLKVLTSGNAPSAIQWIKKYGNNDWRNVADNSTVSGSSSEQLTFTKISVRDSGIYKVRVTFPTKNNTQCTETSQIIRTIHVKPVVDSEPPLFVGLPDNSRILCVDDLDQAEWSESQREIIPAGARFHRLHKFTSLFDLSFTHFSDQITPSADLVLHWGIFSAASPFGPVQDEASNLLENRTGQVSLHPENIDLESLSGGSRNYRIIFWLEDGAGNLTPETLRHNITLTVVSRPEIISQF